MTNTYALPASAAATFPVTGEAAVAFNAPVDWGKTQKGGLETGLPEGYYGMNFRSMPELDWAFGYPFALTLMGLVSATLFLIFRRRGWI